MPVMTDLKRFEKTAEAYEKYPVIKNKVLLYGSSFFTRWGYERARAQLSGICGEEIAVVNHGFGGSTGDEQLYYYPRLVKPYDPKMIVLRGCANDIMRGYTPDEAAEATMRLFGFAKADRPDLKFAVLTAFDFMSAPDREGVVDGMAYYNNKMKKYADETDGLYVIDFIPLLYKDPACAGSYRNFREELFIEDGLHFTDAAYSDVFAPFFKREIERILMA